MIVTFIGCIVGESDIHPRQSLRPVLPQPIHRNNHGLILVAKKTTRKELSGLSVIKCGCLGINGEGVNDKDNGSHELMVNSIMGRLCGCLNY